MEIEYRSKELELCALDESYALRRMGKKTGGVLQFANKGNQICREL